MRPDRVDDRVDSNAGAVRWKKRANVALFGFLLVAGYFLVAEHRAHLAGVLGYLPFLLLLACPLMHLFMHRGHGHHGHGGSGPDGARPPPPADRHAEGNEASAGSPPHRHH